MGNGAVEAEKEEKDGWKKRWLVVREGYLTLWLDRTEEGAMVGFEVSKCVGFHDRIDSGFNAGRHRAARDVDPPRSANVLRLDIELDSTTGLIVSREICGVGTVRASKAGRMEGVEGKNGKKWSSGTGTWLVLRLSDETRHSDLVRILHRVAYS